MSDHRQVVPSRGARAGGDVSGCLACDLAAGRRPLPGGRIAHTSRWLVEPCIGPLEPGTLVVKPVRHVLHVADLDVVEATELGPLLQRCAAVLTRVLRPSQVYMCLWSHPEGEPVHLHFVLQPVAADTVRRFGASGPDLQTAMFAAGQLPPEDQVAGICERLRAEWPR